MATNALLQHQQSQQNQQYYQHSRAERQHLSSNISRDLANEQRAAGSNPNYYRERGEVIKSLGEQMIACACVCAIAGGIGAGIIMMGFGVADLAKGDRGDGGTLFGVGLGMTTLITCTVCAVLCRSR